MKVYEDINSPYILIRNKDVLKSAGFRSGMTYNIEVEEGKIILSLSVISFEEG